MKTIIMLFILCNVNFSLLQASSKKSDSGKKFSVSSNAFAKKKEKEAKRIPNQQPDEDESSAEFVDAIQNTNCNIRVISERHSGVKDVQDFYTQVQSKQECEDKAKPHRHNLFPEQVKKKTVRVHFLGE